MANSTTLPCPYPFLNESDYSGGGYVGGRICASVGYLEGAECCVACPFQELVYSDEFTTAINAAFWVAVPAIVLQVFLLVTFLVLPEKYGHGNYLNWALVISVIILELSFIVALNAKGDLCYDTITPNDMYSSMLCAWSGALLLAGAMATSAWILVRSLYTHLRVVWNLDLPRWYPIVSHSIGWGLPIVFLAIGLPITGVSYQVGALCLLKQHEAPETWFGWYLAFSGLAAVLQICTTSYCVMIYVMSQQHGAESSVATNTTSSTAGLTNQKQTAISGMYHSRSAWKRIRKILLLQWRSIVLSLLVVVLAIYFGVIYITISDVAKRQIEGLGNQDVIDWAVCLIVNKGNKQPCLTLAAKLGLGENGAVASVTLVVLTGIVTFLLLVQRSMFVGWYQIFKDPRHYLRNIGRRRSSVEETFVVINPHDREKGMSVRPEPGDVATRHETTTAFDDDAEMVQETETEHEIASAEQYEKAGHVHNEVAQP